MPRERYDRNTGKKSVFCSTCDSEDFGNWGTCPECTFYWESQYQHELEPDDQDWSFAFCEECGSTLYNDGVCHNTSCGNSPFQGTDWE